MFVTCSLTLSAFRGTLDIPKTLHKSAFGSLPFALSLLVSLLSIIYSFITTIVIFIITDVRDYVIIIIITLIIIITVIVVVVLVIIILLVIFSVFGSFIRIIIVISISCYNYHNYRDYHRNHHQHHYFRHPHNCICRRHQNHFILTKSVSEAGAADRRFFGTRFSSQLNQRLGVTGSLSPKAPSFCKTNKSVDECARECNSIFLYK